MQFINNAPLYKIVRITGPHHNLLGLQLTLEPTRGEPKIEVLDSPPNGRDQAADRRVAEQVMLGIDEVCREIGKQYYVEKIQYVSDDSPPVTVYRQLVIGVNYFCRLATTILAGRQVDQAGWVSVG